mmetsp:Transcript_62403/g.197726  ORF Transcript_62403/g.197726 Transcript_62403/m.197726 type:complete len:474 (+) Transcript_62403:197-1618(+)
MSSMDAAALTCPWLGRLDHHLIPGVLAARALALVAAGGGRGHATGGHGRRGRHATGSCHGHGHRRRNRSGGGRHRGLVHRGLGAHLRGHLLLGELGVGRQGDHGLLHADHLLLHHGQDRPQLLLLKLGLRVARGGGGHVHVARRGGGGAAVVLGRAVDAGLGGLREAAGHLHPQLTLLRGGCPGPLRILVLGLAPARRGGLAAVGADVLVERAAELALRPVPPLEDLFDVLLVERRLDVVVDARAHHLGRLLRGEDARVGDHGEDGARLAQLVHELIVVGTNELIIPEDEIELKARGLHEVGELIHGAAAVDLALVVAELDVEEGDHDVIVLEDQDVVLGVARAAHELELVVLLSLAEDLPAEVPSHVAVDLLGNDVRNVDESTRPVLIPHTPALGSKVPQDAERRPGECEGGDHHDQVVVGNGGEYRHALVEDLHNDAKNETEGHDSDNVEAERGAALRHGGRGSKHDHRLV